MKFGVLVICILLAYEICSTNYNINLTTTYNAVFNQAFALIGSSTKAFPNEAFINFILYGRTDVPFKYYDFLSSFGYKTTEFAFSFLIIGNDGKLGGICIDSFTVVLPVPRGKVTRVQVTNLKKYFSKGYTILAKYPYDFNSQKHFRSANVLINGYTFCSNCSADLLSSEYASTLFTDNNQIIYNITSLPTNITIVLYGHLTQYDGSAQVGNFSVSCGYFNRTWLFTDPSVPNQITFAFKLLRSTSSGSVIVYNQKKKFNYTFSATEY